MSDLLTRHVKPVLGTILALVAMGLAGDVPFHLGISVFDQQALGIILGVGLAVVFIAVPARGKAGPDRTVPVYDAFFALLAIVAGIYFAVRYPVLSNEFYFRQTETFIVGIVFIPLVIEALRRTAGLGLVTILGIFLLYGLVADLVPGQLNGRAQSFPNLVSYLGVDLNALFGLPLVIITSIVVVFIFLGQLLLRTGGSEWFTDLAIGLTGRSRGGSAKIAIVASGLFGSISGSAVSNVASTGVLTIPLMRRGGYSPQAAGAIEAVASTGGQIMPPIMGAAAFLMSERLAIGYSEIVIAALLPALLYYVAVFIQADVEAARRNIPPIPREQMRPMGQVMREGWFFALPFAVLILALFWLNRRPETAALWASATIVIVSFVFGYKGRRIGWRDIVKSISATGAISVDIIVIGAMAGLLIGVIEISGLSFGLTFLLVQVGQSSLFLLLLLTAVVSVILGMGMPTTAIYLIVATLAAPPLRKLGIDPIAADMFVLYFGLLSMITPPVAIAAFTAANLAGAKPLQTALLACRYGWPAFVLPFLFVLSPSLLLQGTALEVIQSVVTAVAGVWFASAGLGGYFRGNLDLLGRAAFTTAGIALLIPAGGFTGAAWIEAAGVVLAAAALLRQVMANRRKPA
ncbi:MAG: TRAP transporter fused permease subunit [Proteobacteria bacterium]|nr:TRAP transporter fused permease subunit [Pseudomonadota bacterium]MDA1057261.1 TRAP transporter fused permease subunit [Pseudomonadota bacterium]